MPSRVLVVEDDDLQQAVLTAALMKRGYEVEVASDGLTAVHKLRAGGYDLALLDYHLPEIDGFASARLLHDLMAEEDRPKLIAVTAAADTLTSREASSGVFDAVVPKPLELSALLTIVDTQLRAGTADRTMRAAEEAWCDLGLNGAPAAITVPRPTPAQSQLLRCYFDLSGRREPEVVLLLGPEADDDAGMVRAQSNHFSLPFVALATGRQADADAIFSAADHSTWRAVATVITHFTACRRQLARDVLRANDLDMRLLAYVFLSGSVLRPSSDATKRECIRYPGYFPDGEARLAAERLADRGLLERRFFERFHACGSCGSSRLNVREECPACRSAQLHEVALVHHFRCAYQAPEAAFARGPHLVCPKCRQHLRHYGSDYDRPGSAVACSGCGVVSPEPTVGFACLDCDAHTDGNAASKRDVFSYVLTESGTALLRRGTARLATANPPADVSLPQAIRDELEHPSEAGAALIELRYGARRDIIRRRGVAGFAAMCRLFRDNLVSAVAADCVLASGPESDYLLIRNPPPHVLAELSPALLEACQEVLAEGLEPELRLIKVPGATHSHHP
jgi:CheY-like chemotaxis protein